MINTSSLSQKYFLFDYSIALITGYTQWLFNFFCPLNFSITVITMQTLSSWLLYCLDYPQGLMIVPNFHVDYSIAVITLRVYWLFQIFSLITLLPWLPWGSIICSKFSLWLLYCLDYPQGLMFVLNFLSIIFLYYRDYHAVIDFCFMNSVFYSITVITNRVWNWLVFFTLLPWLLTGLDIDKSFLLYYCDYQQCLILVSYEFGAQT